MFPTNSRLHQNTESEIVKASSITNFFYDDPNMPLDFANACRAGKQVQTAVFTPAIIILDFPVFLMEEGIRGSSKGFTFVRSIIS